MQSQHHPKISPPKARSVFTRNGDRGAVLADLYQTLLTGDRRGSLPMWAKHGFLLEINGQCYILVFPESTTI